MAALSASGRDNLGTCIAMLALGVLSVVVRFAARISQGPGLLLSDWLLSIGLVFMIIFEALWINYTTAGPGKGSLDFNQLHTSGEYGTIWTEKLFKTLWIGGLFYLLSVAFIKLSILAFCNEIFGISKSFRRFYQGTAFLCILWLVLLFFMELSLCSSIPLIWETRGSSSACRLRPANTALGMELTNLLTDIVILLLPLFMIQRLNLKKSQKYSLAAIFLFGGLVCITSIVKLSYQWRPEGMNIPGISNTVIWSSIHLGIALLSACLPTYRPLLNLQQERRNTWQSTFIEPFNRSPLSPLPQAEKQGTGFYQLPRPNSTVPPASNYSRFSIVSRPVHQSEENRAWDMSIEDLGEDLYHRAILPQSRASSIYSRYSNGASVVADFSTQELPIGSYQLPPLQLDDEFDDLGWQLRGLGIIEQDQRYSAIDHT